MENPNTGFARIVAAADPLVTAAHESASLLLAGSDPELWEQILALIASIANIPGEPTFREPVLDAALDALRPRGQQLGHP